MVVSNVRLGSANATRRAWSGRNAEATLELRITEGVEVGLKALVGAARCIPVPEREFEPDAVTLEEEALERARAQVAARWGQPSPSRARISASNKTLPKIGRAHV